MVPLQIHRTGPWICEKQKCSVGYWLHRICSLESFFLSSSLTSPLIQEIRCHHFPYITHIKTHTHTNTATWQQNTAVNQNLMSIQEAPDCKFGRYTPFSPDLILVYSSYYLWYILQDTASKGSGMPSWMYRKAYGWTFGDSRFDSRQGWFVPWVM